MNGRQRILAAFRGEQPDTVPFAPNIYQWFYYHYRNGTLPADVSNATHPYDVLRFLGAEILARWDTFWATRHVYTAGEFHEEYVGDTNWDQPLVTAFNIYPPHKTGLRKRFVTPHGTLTQMWNYMPEAGADFESKYWWTEWEEYEAVRFLVEARDYVFDAAEFDRWVKRVGDDGVVMVNLTESPLKALHWLAGPQNATMFILKHPEEMQALARIHEVKALKLLKQAVDHVGADIFIAIDNLDSAFYPPYFYRDYCDSFFSRAAEIIHKRDKHFVVHACGRSKVLLPLVGGSQIDSLEGITPPPMGDVQLRQVRELVGYDRFTVNGGMTTRLQELQQDAEATIHAYTRELFQSLGDRRRFIYASSCNTSPLTPWENLLHFRNAARIYGKT
jgi:uroporphyrinogen-III decarboxylase